MWPRRVIGVVAALGVAALFQWSCSGSTARDQNYGSEAGADFEAPIEGTGGASGTGGAGGGSGGAGGASGIGGDTGLDGGDAGVTGAGGTASNDRPPGVGSSSGRADTRDMRPNRQKVRLHG